MKTEGADGSGVPAVRVAELDANKNWIRQTVLYFDHGTNDWIKKETTFQTGVGTEYLLVLANIWNGYGTFWVDDISLVDTTTPTPTPTPDPSVGNTYYVAKNGNNNNPGTETQPWLTIGKAANTAVAGDTVYIKEGRYNENVVIKNSGLPEAHITFTAYPGHEHKVIMDGAGLDLTSPTYALLKIQGIKYIDIIGLRFENSNFEHIRIQGPNTANINIKNNQFYNSWSRAISAWSIWPRPAGLNYEYGGITNLIIHGNDVQKANNGGYGEMITLAAGVDNFEIMNNEIHNAPITSYAAGEGIDISGCRNGKIHDNHVYGLDRVGIYLDAWTGHNYNIDIYNNRVHDNDPGSGITVAAEAGGITENIRIYNNLVYNNGWAGFAISKTNIAYGGPGTIRDISVINNVFYDDVFYLNNVPGISGIVIRNNIAAYVEQDSSIPYGAINMDHNFIDNFNNAKFVDPLNGDFHLKSTSPAIDTGINTDAPSVDFDGILRPRGAGIDIGAHEY
jgi:hypothetical protein